MSKRSGHTLIATLAAVLILLLLGMVALKGGLGGTYTQNTSAKPRADGLGNTMPSYMKLKAQDDVCRSNLNQARQAVAIARMSNGDEAPTSLEETRLAESFLSCPIGKEKYAYDPAAGTVKCPHPGHEKY